jgi:hypothetical protein
MADDKPVKAPPTVTLPPTACAPGQIDEAIDNNTAMIYSPFAPRSPSPAADTPSTKRDDHKAIWCHIPSPSAAFKPSNPELLIFYHGFNNISPVTLSGGKVTSRVPSFITRRGDSAGTPACGPKYKLDAVATSKHDPISIAPEVGLENTEIDQTESSARQARNAPKIKENQEIDKRNKVRPKGTPAEPHVPLEKIPPWSTDTSGNLTTATSLGAMVDDTFVRLGKLLTVPGCTSAYIDPTLKLDKSKIKRIFLSGHSGGGVPLVSSAISDLALSVSPLDVPVSLWVLDAAYGDKTKEIRKFCESWSAWKKTPTDAPQNRLGNGPRDSCLVIVSNIEGVKGSGKNDSDTAQGTRKIITDLTTVKPTFAIPEFFNKTNADLATIEPELSKNAIIMIWTHVVHDEIPKVFIPLLVKNAPG